MGCDCGTTRVDYVHFALCEQATPLPLVDDNTLTTYAARNGATSKNGTMCASKAFMLCRRFIYSKKTPGDCGSAKSYDLPATSNTIGAGITGLAASGDPEPISKGILSGLSAIFGGFGAAHTAAVMKEEDTICAAAVIFNQTIIPMEQAVIAGQITPDQASGVLNALGSQVDQVLSTIYKSCNAACVYRTAVKALVNFMEEVAFPILAPKDALSAAFQATQPPAPISPGVPVGNMGTPLNTPIPPYPVPHGYPSDPSPFSGASGPIFAPLTGNNIGSGASVFPSTFPIGTLVLIGGVLYIAS